MSKKFTVCRYSTKEVEVAREKWTGMPILDTIANVEIAKMTDDGWMLESLELVKEEHRHDPSHGYRGDGRHVWTPDVITHHVYAVALFSK